MEHQVDAAIAQADNTMVIVTTAAGEHKAGCLVGFSSQVSMDPLRYLAALSVHNHTFRVARRADRLAVHILSTADAALAQLFGSETGDEIDKFAHCRWHWAEGVPVLDDAGSWFVGKIIEQIQFGDHVGFLLNVEPSPAHTPTLTEPLRLSGVAELEPGHPA